MSLQEEGSLSVLWRELPIEDLLRLCTINRYMKSICDRDDTWTFLIKRDFNIDYDIVNPHSSKTGESSSPRRYYLILYDTKNAQEFINSTYKLYAINDVEPEANLYNIIALDYNDMLRILAERFKNDEIPIVLKRTIEDYIEDFEDGHQQLDILKDEKISREMKLFGFTIPRIPYPFDIFINNMKTGRLKWIEIIEKPFIISNSVVKNIK
jgi:hypothetical protein